MNGIIIMPTKIPTSEYVHTIPSRLSFFLFSLWQNSISISLLQIFHEQPHFMRQSDLPRIRISQMKMPLRWSGMIPSRLCSLLLDSVRISWGKRQSRMPTPPPKYSMLSSLIHVKQSMLFSKRRSKRADKKQSKPMIMDLCMVVISRIRTGISGKHSGWMRVRCRKSNTILTHYHMFKNYLDYIRDNPHGYWFKRKLYGWGWTPVTWQ